MALGETINTAVVLIFGGTGILVGIWGPGLLRDKSSHRAAEQNSDPASEERDISINLAILYATLTLVITSVVSEWPPQGQELPQFFTSLVFAGSVFAGALILTRVSHLVLKLEKHGAL